MNYTTSLKQVLIIPTLMFLLLTSTSYAQHQTYSLKKYTEKELSSKSVEELALLRNEILARKGYVFSKGIYADYFDLQDWYKPIQSNTTIVLTENENVQIDLIKKIENQKKVIRTKALSDLKELKKVVNSNNKTLFDKLVPTKEKDVNLMDGIKDVLNTCNIDGINWTQKEGLYKVTIDNGDAISIYYIKFTNTEVILSGGRIKHSEIHGDFNDGYSGYHSEDEYVEWFYFKLTEQGLKFDRWNIAG
ncbi:MAG: YARHG domain-containing protein [Flavobacteriaceae bacterium]|jgi:hypothetical protein|nr:YARHG domain-containing protein [Flavobacteriaceae bacterium]